MKKIIGCFFISLCVFPFLVSAQPQGELSQNFLERFYKVTQQPLPVIPLNDLTSSGDHSASILIEADQLIIGNRLSLNLSKSSLSLSQIKVDAKNSSNGLLVDYSISNGEEANLNNVFTKIRLFIPTKQPHELFVGFLSKDNEVVSHKSGYAIAVYEMDELSRVTSVRYLDTKMQPVLSNRSFHQKLYKFEGNRLVSVSFLGVNGEPVVTEPGVSKTLYHYDENEQITSMTSLDANGLKISECHFNNNDSIKFNVSFDPAIELEDKVVIKLFLVQ